MKNEKFTGKIRQIILDNYEKSYGEIAGIIEQETGKKLSEDNVRKRYRALGLPHKRVTGQVSDPVVDKDFTKVNEVKQKVKTGIETRLDGHIVINWDTKTIITQIGEFGTIVSSFDMHKAIQRHYVSMGENETAAVVAMKFDFPHAKAVHLYAKLHGFTKSSLPQTDIEFESGMTADEAVKENLQTIKREAYKKTEQEKWKMTQQDANKWRQFKHNVLKPFENYIADQISVRSPIKYVIPKTKVLDFNVVVGVTDVHYLKLCVDDFGNITYNQEIARTKLFETQKDLIEMISRYGRPEKFTVIVGSDGIHVDNPQLTTTNGTNLGNSTAGEWHMEIGNYVDIQLDYIDLFANIAPVDVVIVPGNHSKNTDYLVGTFLKKYYEKVNKTVNVIEALNSERTYIPYGDKFCLVFQHGDNVSIRKMDNEMHKVIMSEARSWGINPLTTVFYHFSGHLHHENQTDLGGNVIRIVLSAFCPPDKWHTQSQYVGTQLKTQHNFIDKEKGRFMTLHI